MLPTISSFSHLEVETKSKPEKMLTPEQCNVFIYKYTLYSMTTAADG